MCFHWKTVDNLIGIIHSWNSGTTHLVLCGDLIGRGLQENQVLDLAMKLEIDALLGRRDKLLEISGIIRYALNCPFSP